MRRRVISLAVGALAVASVGTTHLDRLTRGAAGTNAVGDWSGAIVSLRRIVRSRPWDAAASRELVWVLGRAGRDSEAAFFLAARPWLYRAAAADDMKRGSHPAGMEARKVAEPPFLSAARDVVRRRPRDAAARASLAEALVRRARGQTAAMASRCMICHHREPPLDGPAITRVLFPDRETLEQALAARWTAARLRPRPTDALRIGQIYFYLATLYPPRHREALEAMARARRSLERAVETVPRSPDAWSSLALVQLKLGNGSGAKRAWEKALGLDPNHEEARVNLANVLPSQGHIAEALRLYEEGLRRRPDSVALRTNYGALLWQMGRYPEAIAAYRETLRRDPGEPVALLNLGLALKATGDSAGAEAALRESIRRRPGGAVAHNALGSLLAQRGDWAAAARAFAAAARHNPGLAVAHANLGRAYERLECWSEAGEAYRRAILCEPERTALWARVAVTMARAGEYRGAIDAAERFMARHPREPDAVALRGQLATWRRRAIRSLRAASDQ